jgi:CheY-like chemotaxis protein
MKPFAPTLGSLPKGVTAVTGKGEGTDTRRTNHPGQRPWRVLLVEDNADGREMLGLLLEMRGYEVVVAADGLQGVAKALEHHPDVAVIDIGLPLLDGYQVAQRLRAELGDAIFLITLTSYCRPEDRDRACEAGFDVHLTKPVDPSELFSWLERAARCTST